MPMKWALGYPANWAAIARARKEAAGWCCERCGVAQGEECLNWRGEPYSVIVTTAHLDHDPWNPAARLAVLCQACHLDYDRPVHTEHAIATWQRKIVGEELGAGQLILIDGALPAMSLANESERGGEKREVVENHCPDDDQAWTGVLPDSKNDMLPHCPPTGEHPANRVLDRVINRRDEPACR
jgi:hypothetical protein